MKDGPKLKNKIYNVDYATLGAKTHSTYENFWWKNSHYRIDNF